MNARNLWSKILIVAGGIGMLVGAIDPLEGSLLILPGSGLFALGTYLGRAERRLIAYRVAVFILIAMGVAALWGLSAVGGFGGTSGRSVWWGLLTLPYVAGWLMVMWGPENPRWFSILGILVGLLYLALAGLLVLQLQAGLEGWRHPTAVTIAAIGVAAIAGCIYRLIKRAKPLASD
jgi:uncharacterized membrane protein YhdT